MRIGRIANAIVGTVAMLGCDARPPVLPDAPGTIPGVEARSLAADLERGGARVSLDSRIPSPALKELPPVGGARYVVDGERLDVLEYAYPEQAETAARLIDPHGSRIGSVFVEWTGQPHFYRKGRLIVLYVGVNPKMLRRLSGALGPPVAGR